MHVPSHVPLGKWIGDLISQGRLYCFYKTDEWKALKAEVERDHNHECERCAERGRYSRSQTVHHEFEVRRHPALALTRYIQGPDGSRREVLHPLCNRCHNDVHGRTLKGASPKPQLNSERWD